MIARGKAAYELEQVKRERHAKYEGKTWFGVHFLDEFGLMAEFDDACAIECTGAAHSEPDLED